MNNTFKVIVEKIKFIFENGLYLPIALLRYQNGGTHEHKFESVNEMEENNYCEGAVLNCELDEDGNADVVQVIPPLTGHKPSDHFPKRCAICVSTLVRSKDNFDCTSSICISNVAPRLQKIAKRYKISLFGGWTGVQLCSTLQIKSATELILAIDALLEEGLKLSDMEGIGVATEKKLLKLHDKLKSIKSHEDYLKAMCINGMDANRWVLLLKTIPTPILLTITKIGAVEALVNMDPEFVQVVQDNLEAIQYELGLMYLKK